MNNRGDDGRLLVRIVRAIKGHPDFPIPIMPLGDALGYSKGRTRKIAEEIARQGYIVINEADFTAQVRPIALFEAERLRDRHSHELQMKALLYVNKMSRGDLRRAVDLTEFLNNMGVEDHRAFVNRMEEASYVTPTTSIATTSVTLREEGRQAALTEKANTGAQTKWEKTKAFLENRWVFGFVVTVVASTVASLLTTMIQNRYSMQTPTAFVTEYQWHCEFGHTVEKKGPWTLDELAANRGDVEHDRAEHDTKDNAKVRSRIVPVPR
jgi:hypothetical protein